MLYSTVKSVAIDTTQASGTFVCGLCVAALVLALTSTHCVTGIQIDAKLEVHDVEELQEELLSNALHPAAVTTKAAVRYTYV